MIPSSPPLPDDLAHDLALTGHRLPPLRDPQTPFVLDAWNVRRAEIQARIKSVIGDFPQLEPCERIRETPRFYCGTVEIREAEASLASGEKIPFAILLPSRPPSACLVAPHPTSLHGMRSGYLRALEPDSFHYALEAAEAGFAVLTYEHFTLPPRQADSPYVSDAFYRRHPEWSATGKAAWDLMQMVEVSQLVPELRGLPLGAIGFSLGAHTSLFAAAFDARIRASVVACGVSSFCGDRNADYVWVRRGGGYSYMPRLARSFDQGDPPSFDFHELAALVAPRSLLMLSGHHDVWCGGTAIMGEFAAHVHDIYDGMQSAPRFAHVQHGDGHGFRGIWRRLAYDWLRSELGGDHGSELSPD